MTADIKRAIEQYFISNWDRVTVPIQFEGTKFNYDDQNDFISLVYNPVINERYGFDGTSCGRVKFTAIQKIFCYAENPTKAYELADTVKTFLNGIDINGVTFDIGQDRTALDLDNGFFEVLVEITLIKYT